MGLDGKPRKPGEIDFYIVGEHRGEYSSVGGRMFAGTEREFVLQEAVFTRTGVDRVLEFASSWRARAEETSHQLHQEQRHFDLDAVLGRTRAAMAPRYPDVRVDKYHVES